MNAKQRNEKACKGYDGCGKEAKDPNHVTVQLSSPSIFPHSCLLNCVGCNYPTKTVVIEKKFSL